MTWGTNSGQKQHVNNVACQAADSQNEFGKTKPNPPQVKIFASTKAYVSAVLMLVCGLFIIVASIACFWISYGLPYHGLPHYVHMCRIFGVCAGVLFSIAGICALMANSKPSKPRLFFAAVFSLLAAIVALLIIIGISLFIFDGVKHYREMRRGRDDPKRFGGLRQPYPEHHNHGDHDKGKMRSYYPYPTPTPAGWDRPKSRPYYWQTRRPWYLGTRRPWLRRPTPPPNYMNPWDRTTRRPWWPTKRPWSDWTTRRPWSDWTTRRPWSDWTTRRPWSNWTTRNPWPQPKPSGRPEPTGYPWYDWTTRSPRYDWTTRRPWDDSTTRRPRTDWTTRRPWSDWTTRRPWYWATTRNPWPQPKPSGRPEPTGYPWYDWTTRSPWYDWTTRRPWDDSTTKRRPWYDWATTRRPWYDWTTRRPWYDWTTRRPWYDWTTRRPWYDWTTRRPWYDWTTRRPWYDWTTRRPWYDWTTRQPWPEQPTPAGWGRHEGGMGWKRMLLFIGGIAVVITVLTELVNAVILTIFGFRSLRPHKYTRLRVAVIVPSDKENILADVDDLPVV
ncbi:foot protein 1 variant 1-like isoform X2 [Lineus longissimus]